MRKRLSLLIQAVEALTEDFSAPADAAGMTRYQISAISERTGILPNNVSSDLNELFLSGHLFKIRGRPVYYLSLPVLERKLRMVVPVNQVDGLDGFCKLIQQDASRPAGVPPEGRGLDAAAHSALDELIGSGDSLRFPIRQAKAAIRYPPPSGLHTLITGQIGVGKSSFARSMYDFAVKSRRLAHGANLVTFNCANYAVNPQLLLSQLFGYVKGAFTGADKDHAGLVEYADNGILFFDEIHRLSPEGQEKLFLLMDRGTYGRLGETDRERRAKVLILGATTEDPDTAMLSTFMRRILVHITLPPLRERSLQERLTLELRFSVEREVISAFCYYACAANIGQLFKDIKLTCANAYYDFLLKKSRSMLLQTSHLDENVRQGLFTASNSRNDLLLPFFKRADEPLLTFDGRLDYRQILDDYLV